MKVYYLTKDTMMIAAERYINTALTTHNAEMLTIVKFIEVTKYPIDKLYIDKFWASLHDNRLIYVDDDLLLWMGFDAAQAFHRKSHFIELLKANAIGYLEYSNDEYNKLLLVSATADTKLYPLAPTGRGTSTIKHLLLDADSLKLAMMTISKGKGKHVRGYYLNLEKLFKIYIEYQSRFKELQYTRQLSETDKKIQALTKEKTEHEGYLMRLEAFNRELIEYKQFLAKTECLYVGSTFDQARQGLFKVSKTANLKARNAVHNNTHPYGDEFVILHTIRCRTALPLEQRVKHVLQHFRPVSNREYYQLPFSLLVRAIEKLDNDLDDEEELANELMDMMSQLKLSQHTIDWLEGVPQGIFLLQPPMERPALMPPEDSAGGDASIVAPVVDSQYVEAHTPSYQEISLTIPTDQLDSLSLPPGTDPQTARPDQQSTSPDQPASNPEPLADTLEPTISPLTAPDTHVKVEPPEQPAAPSVVVTVFTYSITGWTADQTREYIVSILPEYHKSVGRKGPSWTTVKRYLVKKLKDQGLSKQPKIDLAREQIIQLCVDCGIPIKK